MKIALDSSVLIYLAYPETSAPIDPSTGKPTSHCQERIESLLEDIDKSGAQLIVPAPVLSELLILAEKRQVEILAALTNKKAVLVLPFDQAAAVENAALRRGKLNRRSRGETKKEVSFDLQILAIARVAGAELLLTDDAPLRGRGEQAGMKVKGIAEIPVHDAKRQIGMFDPADVSVPTAEDVPRLPHDAPTAPNA